jgi:lysophospholipase L1-like esterase
MPPRHLGLPLGVLPPYLPRAIGTAGFLGLGFALVVGALAMSHISDCGTLRIISQPEFADMADQFPTKQNFYDAEKDLRTVSAVSNSKDPDTGVEIDTWQTRTGGQTDTLAGRLKALGIERIGDFTVGCTVTKRNQGVLEVGGSVYVWLGAIPIGGKVVPPTSTPASTGGIGPTGWLDVGDASAYTRVLASLAAPGGVDLVNGAAKQSDLSALDSRVDYLEYIQGDTNKTAAHIAKMLSDGGSPIISCYGDSTMYGQVTNSGPAQDPNNPPSKLQLALNLIYGVSLTVNNRGISGSNLRGMMSGTDGSGSTFESKISPGGVDQNAHVIICNHGINNSQDDLSIDQYRLDLVEFVRLCRINGKVPVLETPNPCPPILITTEAKNKRLLSYVRVMRDVARKMGIDLVDTYDLMTKSFKYFRPEEMYPDGVHPASFVYRQCGFNLAVPFISSATISKPGDFSTLTNVSYFDNLTLNRMIQTQPSRGGQLLTAARPTSGVAQGVNYPVIFGDAIKCFSIWGLQWNDAANCAVLDNGESSGSYYQQKQFGNQSSLDWDSDCKFYGRKLAGLHVIGVLFDMVTTGLGSSFAFGGIALPELKDQSFTGPQAQVDSGTSSVVDAGDTMVFKANIDSTGVYLSDKGGSAVLNVRNNGGVITVDLYKNNSIVQTGASGSGVAVGEYGVEIKSYDTSVDVTVGIITVSIPVTSKLPNMKMYSAFINYSIKPTFN